MSSASAPIVRVPSFPKIPDELRVALPELKGAFDRFDNQVEEWRKSVSFPSGSRTTVIERKSVTPSGGQPSGGTSTIINQIDPDAEVEHLSLWIMSWLGL